MQSLIVTSCERITGCNGKDLNRHPPQELCMIGSCGCLVGTTLPEDPLGRCAEGRKSTYEGIHIYACYMHTHTYSRCELYLFVFT